MSSARKLCANIALGLRLFIFWFLAEILIIISSKNILFFKSEKARAHAQFGTFRNRPTENESVFISVFFNRFFKCVPDELELTEILEVRRNGICKFPNFIFRILQFFRKNITLIIKKVGFLCFLFLPFAQVRSGLNFRSIH